MSELHILCRTAHQKAKGMLLQAPVRKFNCIQAHLAKQQLSRGVHPPTAITQPPSLLSTLPPSPFCPSPFLMRVREYHPGKIVELKMLVGEF